MIRGGLALLLAVCPAVAAAQLPEVRGYYLNVPYAADGTPLSDAVFTDFQRARIMTRPAVGPVVIDLEYEHLLTISSVARQGPLLGLQPGAAGGDWLPLQGTLADPDHLVWRHRLDRASVRLATDDLAVTVGRQAISLATTLFLTPADPFMPFDPSDPFREYRRGVDALRVRGFLGPMTEVEAVARLAEFDDETVLTALARGRTAIGRLDVTGWAGAVHDDPAVSLGATVTAWGAAWRGEGVLRRVDDSTVVRVALGVDRSFVLGRRTLYLTLEYQHDGFGAADATELPGVIQSPAAGRGELQVFGRDEAVVQASLDVHPLWTTDLLGIWNMGDMSLLVAPGTSYSLSNEVSLRGGVFVGLGDGVGPDGTIGSEYGLVPTSGYVSVSAFF